jgi:hypothetical protein
MATAREECCPRCGAGFGCDPEGACWCARLSRRLAVPQEREAQCLCPRCLAAELERQGDAR